MVVPRTCLTASCGLTPVRRILVRYMSEQERKKLEALKVASRIPRGTQIRTDGKDIDFKTYAGLWQDRWVEASPTFRHEEISLFTHDGLSDFGNSLLRKPHWTVTPTFWLACVGAAAGIIGVVSSWWVAVQRPVQPAASGSPTGPVIPLASLSSNTSPPAILAHSPTKELPLQHTQASSASIVTNKNAVQSKSSPA